MPLNIENSDELCAYLRSHNWIAADERPSVRVLAGGVSNRTVLVELTDGRSWVIKQALEKLRVKVDWFSNPARIHREAAALRILPGLAPVGSITPLIFEDMQLHLLAMQAVAQPHTNWKTLLMSGHIDIGHVRQFGRLLGRIHRQAAERPHELRALFGDRSFFQSLRVEPYYEYAARQVPQSTAFYDALIRDTMANHCTLVHGDYSPKNTLIHNERLVLLDHEVIHWGDGAFDIGFALAHLLSKAHLLAGLREKFTRAATVFWDVYCAETNWKAPMEPRAVRHALGCLLARVRGRSPLEYLDEAHRQRQEQAVTALMKHPPQVMKDLIAQFVEQLGQS